MKLFNAARPEDNIRTGVILAFVVVALLALVTWASISAQVRDARRVEHGVMVLDGIDNLDGQLTHRTEAERIYQLTSDRSILTRYQSLSAGVRASLDNLRQLTAENPRQQQHLQEITSLVRQTERQFSTLTAGSAASVQPRSVPPVMDQALSAELDARLDAMRSEEHRLLETRRQGERETIALAYTFLTLLGLVLSAVLGGTYAIAKRALEARRLALQDSTRLYAELEKANAALEHKSAEAERSNKLKSQFLASMSHELRTPLNAISGFSELLADKLAGPLTGKQERFLSHIREASRHLLQLINDILDLSKIEAGETHLDLVQLSPAAVINEVITGVGPLAREKAIQLTNRCDESFLLRADHRRLKQILYNLVSNALKFTPFQGRISVTVARDGDFFRFEVTDTGPGISKEDQKIIFEEFRQAAPSASGVKEGTGLGLTVTRKLVQRHGGRIEVESEPGSGSCFRFWLPADTSPAAAAPSNPVAARETRAAVPGQSTPLVLVVDDDPQACELIRNVLEDAGYCVAVAGSCAEALRTARELQPDLITLDLLMPGGNGFGTLYELKNALREEMPPVIIVSVVDDRPTAFALGAADYLLKPVSKDDLLGAVRRHLPVKGAGILVIDDDPAMLDLAREVFSEPWMQLHLAPSGDEGLAIARAKPIDAIILDLLMPGMSGLEVLTALRRDPRLARIPVSILTSRDLSDEETQQLLSKVGAIFHKNEDWRSRLVSQIALSLSSRPPDQGVQT